MNCKRVRFLLTSYISGELTDTERSLVEQHLTGCSGCRTTLASFRALSSEFAVLPSIPLNTEIIDRTFSRIAADRVNRFPTNHWLQAAFIAAAAIAIVAVCVVLFALPARAPGDILASALANTRNLQSFRVSNTAYEKDQDSNEWIATWYKDTEYAGLGNFHVKAKFLPSLTTNTENEVWETWETIVYNHTGYYYYGSTPAAYSVEELNKGFSDVITDLQQPADALKILDEIDKLPDETIDGVACSHYHGLVDLEDWVQQHMIDYKASRPDASPALLLMIEDMWRSKKITYDYWIGKNNDIIHQWSMVLGDAANAVEKNKEIFRYYGFNEEITIAPPVDAQGNLLPGWKTQPGS